MAEGTTDDPLIHDLRAMASLLEQPERGLSSWHAACQSVAGRIVVALRSARETPPTDISVLLRRVREYFTGGGLFNPELAQHDAVRDLLVDVRECLSARETTITLTPEQIHDLCHDLPATVSRAEFEAGCRAYQDKLYGAREAIGKPAAAAIQEPDERRIRAEALWEELGGDLCICQRSDVPHWCENCQRRIDLIISSFRKVAG